MSLVAFHHEPTWSALRPARSAQDVASPYFVEFHRDFEAARSAWMELDGLAPASPYQSFEFCRNWSQTVGAGLGIKPLIVVIRNGVGEVLGLLPLGSYRIGPLTAATLLGGRMANFPDGLVSSGTALGARSRRKPAARHRQARGLRSLWFHQPAAALARIREPDRVPAQPGQPELRLFKRAAQTISRHGSTHTSPVFAEEVSQEVQSAREARTGPLSSW